jgi:hypothetical protein
MKKILLAAFPVGILGYSGYALCEDGHGICGHASSSIEWAKHDLGLTSDWKHVLYAKYCPEGYELVWVDDPDNSDEWRAAVKLNREVLRA